MVIITDRYYSVCNSVGIYRQTTTVGIYRRNYRRHIQNKKKQFADVEVFAGDFTNGITEGIQTGIFVQ
jgi:hypothetical protein